MRITVEEKDLEADHPAETKSLISRHRIAISKYEIVISCHDTMISSSVIFTGVGCEDYKYYCGKVIRTL